MNLQHLSQNKNNTRIGLLSRKKITMLARSNGFEQRAGSVIKASTLIASFMNMITHGSTSYWAWSCNLSLLTGKSISKQAICKRMSSSWVATVKSILKEVINIPITKNLNHALFAGFTNVYLQDSTTLCLPEVLRDVFKGNVSRGKQKAVAKINVVINVVNGNCPVMELMSYTKPEQSLAINILGIAKAGDLVIRDLGYFVAEAFKEMQKNGIEFLSRLRFGVNLYCPKTGEQIDLKQILRKKKYVDIEVLCTRSKDLRVRLVAIKLSRKQTEAKVRKAKKDRDRRLNHSPKYYLLLGYIIFITSVKSQVWSHFQVAEAYRIRWNIEILFKSWKSGFNIEKLIPSARTRTDRVESVLYLILIYLTMFQSKIYVPIRWYKEHRGKHLSMMKLAKYMKNISLNNMEMTLEEKIIKQIIYQCCYDKRSDRLNANQRLEMFYTKLS